MRVERSHFDFCLLEVKERQRKSPNNRSVWTIYWIIPSQVDRRLSSRKRLRIRSPAWKATVTDLKFNIRSISTLEKSPVFFIFKGILLYLPLILTLPSKPGLFGTVSFKFFLSLKMVILSLHFFCLGTIAAVTCSRFPSLLTIIVINIEEEVEKKKNSNILPFLFRLEFLFLLPVGWLLQSAFVILTITILYNTLVVPIQVARFAYFSR